MFNNDLKEISKRNNPNNIKEYLEKNKIYKKYK